MKNVIIFRYIAYILACFLVFILERTNALSHAFFDIPICLYPVIVLSIALFETPLRSFFTAVIFGLLTDFYRGDVIGFDAMILGALAFMISMIISYYIKLDVLTGGFLVFVSSFIKIVLDWLVFYYLSGHDRYFYAFTSKYLASLTLTFAMVPIVYFCYNGINKLLENERQ